MKTIAVMQPYFLPYLGYWQLIRSVDEFVVYDNIEFTKKGWFNRNRILEAGHDRLFTIPIKKDSDYLPVDQRHLADDSNKEIERILRIIEMTYKKAPYFAVAYPIIVECFRFEERNLFGYIHHSLDCICTYLQIETKLVLSSHVSADHSLKGAKKVQAICQSEDASTYINSIGGQKLYDKAEFTEHGIDLQFIQSNLKPYHQFGDSFVPGLSIIDIMMFNDVSTIQGMLTEYHLV